MAVSIDFFRAAATALPTLLIAFGFASSVLNPVNRRTEREKDKLKHPRSVALALLALISTVVAELIALVSIAASAPTFLAYVIVLLAFSVLLTGLASMALYPLMDRYLGSRLEGVEIPLFALVSVATCILASWILL